MNLPFRSRISIRSPRFSLELAGGEAFVSAGYEGLRAALLSAVEDTVAAAALGPPAQLDVPVPQGPGRLAVQVTVCHDLYRRCYAGTREQVQASALLRCLDLSRVEDIWVERTARERVVREFHLGAPLWSQVTQRGAALSEPADRAR